MSKRYGRNQKRAARAEIAGLKESLARDRALMHQTVNDNRDLLEVMQRARAILGRHSVALPVQHMGGHPQPLGGDFDVHVHQPFSLGGKFESMQVQIERMYELLVMVEEGSGFDYGALHCTVELDSGKVAYAISRAAIQRMSPMELQQALAPRIALELAGHLAKGVKGGWA